MGLIVFLILLLLALLQSEQIFRWEARFDSREHSAPFGALSLNGERDPCTVIMELSHMFFQEKWWFGQTGSMAIQHGSRCFVTPRDLNDWLEKEDICIFDSKGNRVEQQRTTEPSKYNQLFRQIFLEFSAKAVLFIHPKDVAMATMLDGSKEFKVTDPKVIEGMGYPLDEELVVPIIEYTPEVIDLIMAAFKANPRSPAVMVRQYGVIVLGRNWKHAKSQAECLDYFCTWVCAMKNAQSPFQRKRGQSKKKKSKKGKKSKKRSKNSSSSSSSSSSDNST